MRPRTERAPSWPPGPPAPPAARAQTAARLRGQPPPSPPRGLQTSPASGGVQTVRAEPGTSQPSPRGVTAPSLAPAFLPCALPWQLLLWKAHPCTRAPACGGDGPAFLSAPTAPHPLRAAAQLWTRVPATRAGEEVPLNPWQQLVRPGTPPVCPPPPRAVCVSLLVGCSLSWFVCHTRVARALPTSCGSGGPEAQLQSQALLWTHWPFPQQVLLCIYYV